MADNAAKIFIFSGRVQGVGFRFTALNVANQYHLTGYVRNIANGSVEMLVQGPAETIDTCVHDILDSFAGYILQTDVKEAPFDRKLTDFRITF